MREITVNRALMELKVLDDRIFRKINEADFIGEAKKSSEKVKSIYTRDEFIKKVRSDYQSISDLIKQRNEIKSKVVLSNAKTEVMIHDRKYTVAEAIDRKNNIELEKALLRKMQEQLTLVSGNVNRRNEKVEDNLGELLKQTFGSDKKVDANLINIMSENYLKEHAWDIINPLNLQNEVDKLRADIENFEKEVDVCLSEINAITKIEISE